VVATSVDGQPIYSSSSDGPGFLIRVDIFAKFSVAGVESDFLQVEVVPPEGPAVHATFDPEQPALTAIFPAAKSTPWHEIDTGPPT
jgi:hypothetical protein